MNKDETISLFQKGREAWNSWARCDQFGVDGSAKSNCTCDADFSGNVFKDEVDFSGYVFPGRTRFDDCLFMGNANFNECEFRDTASFDRAKFNQKADFGKAVFLAAGHFTNSEWNGPADFSGCRFESMAFFEFCKFLDSVSYWFTEFCSQADFHDSSIVGEASFYHAIFNGRTYFLNVDFLEFVNFRESEFREPTEFESSKFGGQTKFGYCEFFDSIPFRAINCEDIFEIDGANFKMAPDFRQAIFKAAPELGGFDSPVEIGSIGFLQSFRISKQINQPQIFRALRIMARASGDVENEIKFLKCEIRSRRVFPDYIGSWRFLIGVGYDVFSDYGRSVTRPILLWLANVYFFVAVYTNAHLNLSHDTSEATTMGIIWGGFLSHFQKLPDGWKEGDCISGTGDVYYSALYLSLRNSLAASGWLGDNSSSESYQCLFGDAVELIKPFNNGLSLPEKMILISIPQSIISILAIFLLFLAIRNFLRLK